MRQPCCRHPAAWLPDSKGSSYLLSAIGLLSSLTVRRCGGGLGGQAAPKAAFPARYGWLRHPYRAGSEILGGASPLQTSLVERNVKEPTSPDPPLGYST